MANGQPWQSNGAKQVLAKVAEHPLWKGRKEWAASGGKDGRGCAAPASPSAAGSAGLQPTGATVRLNPDGSLNVLTGQVDIAGTNISLAQIAASAYGVDFDQVKITTGDTDSAPLTGLSAGSKTIYTVGTAVLQAAQDARRQTFEIAAKEMEASVHDLEIRDGKVIVKGAPDKSVTLASIGKKGNLYMSKVPPVLGTATPAFSQQAPGFAAQIARIEVDPDTGETHAARLRGHPGRRQGHQPARRGRPDAGRRRAEPRHGDDRGAHVRRRRATDEPEPARLPQAHRRGPAQHRDHHRGGPVAVRPLRRARAWGSRPSCRRRPPSPTPWRTRRASAITELPVTPERIALARAAKGNGG